MSRIVFLNTTIATFYPAVYRLEKVDTEAVKKLVNGSENRLSAVGHAATAEVMTSLLGVNIPVNRIQYSQEIGDVAVCFKLKTRIAEGVVLTTEELEKLEFDWVIMTRIE